MKKGLCGIVLVSLLLALAGCVEESPAPAVPQPDGQTVLGGTGPEGLRIRSFACGTAPQLGGNIPVVANTSIHLESIGGPSEGVKVSYRLVSEIGEEEIISFESEIGNVEELTSDMQNISLPQNLVVKQDGSFAEITAEIEVSCSGCQICADEDSCTVRETETYTIEEACQHPN